MNLGFQVTRITIENNDLWEYTLESLDGYVRVIPRSLGGITLSGAPNAYKVGQLLTFEITAHV
jgi:hypothetical protein